LVSEAVLVEQPAFVPLLLLGLFFPTSTGGVHSGLLYELFLGLAMVSLSYLVWKHGTRLGAVGSIALPIIAILAAGTFYTSFTQTFPVGWGIMAEYISLALLLSLDLRNIGQTPAMRSALVVVNLVSIACGFAIVAGNEKMGQFLTDYYAQFYDDLLPNMISLHKPVLSFGTHAVAGFFLYVFFWLNWETYKSRPSILVLCFALSWLVLLIALTSFTAFGLAALAFAQIALWLWKGHRTLLASVVFCLLAGLLLGGQLIQDYFDISDVAEMGAGMLASDNVSGPLARYGAGGSERDRIDYFLEHPLAPVGVAVPVFALTVDSGPIGYLVRGSVPLLVLVYFGLYKFLRYNLISRRYALTLFLLIVVSETAFTALTYLRTFFLLPIVIVYLNHICREMDCRVSEGIPLGTQLQEGVS
jgi:hypothetical protein